MLIPSRALEGYLCNIRAAVFCHLLLCAPRQTPHCRTQGIFMAPAARQQASAVHVSSISAKPSLQKPADVALEGLPAGGQPWVGQRASPAVLP